MVRLPSGLQIFLFCKASTAALRPTSSPIQSVSGAFSQRVKRPGLETAIYLHLVRRLRIVGALPVLPYMPSWRVKKTALLHTVAPSFWRRALVSGFHIIYRLRFWKLAIASFWSSRIFYHGYICRPFSLCRYASLNDGDTF